MKSLWNVRRLEKTLKKESDTATGDFGENKIWYGKLWSKETAPNVAAVSPHLQPLFHF